VDLDPRHFWAYVDELVRSSSIAIDRPKDTAHPKYPQYIYPLDYGYLENTTSADGGGIDIWRGSEPEPSVVGLLCTVDLWKRDMEVKLLLGCTAAEIAQVQDFFTMLKMGHTLLLRNSDGERPA
jgi:inorganic pyrophosphatase